MNFIGTTACKRKKTLAELSAEELQNKKTLSLTFTILHAILSIITVVAATFADNLAIGIVAIGMLGAIAPHINDFQNISRELNSRN